MSAKSPDQALDDALGAILNKPWDTPPKPADAPAPAAPEATAPPEAPVPAVMEKAHPPLPVDPYEYDPHDEESAKQARSKMSVGVLADLASGRRSAEDVAEHVGVSGEALHAQLATALREVPPDEIAKALGLQAAQQQLTSGAVYGAVLADLVRDMVADRLKPETKIELARLLARVGRIEPKEDKGAGVGSGFVLNIQVGQGAQPITIEAE